MSEDQSDGRRMHVMPAEDVLLDIYLAGLKEGLVQAGLNLGYGLEPASEAADEFIQEVRENPEHLEFAQQNTMAAAQESVLRHHQAASN